MMTPATTRLLLVEDDAYLASMLSQLLQEHGYDVSTCSTLADTRRLMERAVFDGVVLDYQLPDGTGLEIAPEFRQKRPGVPVILISGWSGNFLAAQAAEAGITDLLPKPFTLEHFMSTVQRVMPLSRREAPRAPEPAETAPAAPARPPRSLAPVLIGLLLITGVALSLMLWKLP